MVAPSSTPVFTSERMRSSCTGATIAPISIALSSGGPTRSFSMRALSFVTRRSAIPSCTSSRDPAQHTCPWLNQIASTTPSTTLSRSASSNTTKGLLPPSSSESFFPEPAVWQPCVVRDLREIQRGERRELRGLQDDRVPRGQRRCDLPRHHQEREVPWNDLAHDSDG